MYSWLDVINVYLVLQADHRKKELNSSKHRYCTNSNIFYVLFSRLKSLQNDGKSPHGSHSDSSHHVNSDSTDDIYTHFSTFAMSGVNGSIRWHHLPGDFEQNNNSVVRNIPFFLKRARFTDQT